MTFCCSDCGDNQSHSRSHNRWCERRKHREAAAATALASMDDVLSKADAIPSFGRSCTSGSKPGEDMEAALARLQSVIDASGSSQGLFQQPLAYRVVRNDPKYPPYASVREWPDSHMPERAQLQHGSVVMGFPSLGWLLLHPDNGPSLVGLWVFIGRQLAACSLQATVHQRLAESIEVEWPGIRTSPISYYTVDWEVLPPGGLESDDDIRSSCGLHQVRTNQPQVEIQCPSSAFAVRLRVVAVAGSRRSAEQELKKVKVFGPWVVADLGEAATAAAETTSSRRSAEEPDQLEAPPVEIVAGAAEVPVAAGTASRLAEQDERPAGPCGDARALPVVAGEAVGRDALAGAPATGRARAATAPAREKLAVRLPDETTPQVCHQQEEEEGSQIEESMLANAARRKWSVKDIIKSFEASRSPTNKSTWQCAECGFQNPKAMKVCDSCDAVQREPTGI